MADKVKKVLAESGLTVDVVIPVWIGFLFESISVETKAGP